MQLGSHISNARSRVFKAPDTRVIMACKTCGQAATLLHQPCEPLAGHSYNAEQPDKTVPYQTACDAVEQHDRTHPTLLKISFATSSRWFPTV
jgi:hypothetical protein